MDRALDFVVGLFGPFGLLLAAQYWAQSQLLKRGLPRSLHAARAEIRARIEQATFSLQSPIEPDAQLIRLAVLVGVDLKPSVREANEQRVRACADLIRGKIRLAVIYRFEPLIVLGCLYAIIAVLTSQRITIVGGDLELFRSAAAVVVFLLSGAFVAGIVYAYQHLQEVLDEITDRQAQPIEMKESPNAPVRV